MKPSFPSIGSREHSRLVEIARELSSFGFGVSVPHMHRNDGSFHALPSGLVALEQKLHVTFVDQSRVASSAVPVGWRWNGSELEVFAACCGDGGDGGPGDGGDGDNYCSDHMKR